VPRVSRFGAVLRARRAKTCQGEAIVVVMCFLRTVTYPRRWYLEQYQCVEDFLRDSQQPAEPASSGARPPKWSYELHSFRCDASLPSRKLSASIGDSHRCRPGQANFWGHVVAGFC
jgi:hypothetical protein